ncbi:MAG: 16S rRNA (uracil(1498)-N(3))-methyltransferase [Actinomycetota bacterium]|nr:16S rRNA (uracil(1498)-N(3))-methyltransferase [Actinomycetota bacterium]MDI6821467.1 16S rRNA (uracil(1498)-N(3))-methyltransferase [Actinomycetota bacterium]
MTEPRFFVPPKNIQGLEICIVGDDVNHIRNVLRLKPGENVIVCDGRGSVYETQIIRIGKQEVITRILKHQVQESLPPHVALFQGLPKGPKMDFIVQKATELGVFKIVPVVMERTVVKLNAIKDGNRVQRWRRIALEAAKQCQRATLPEVSEPISLVQSLELLPNFDSILIFWEEEKKASVREVLNDRLSAGRRGMPEKVAMVIGPEGGLTEEEVLAIRDIGGQTVTLGNLILRTETASIVGLAIVLYELGKLA